VLAAFWIVMLVLGIGGFQQQAHDTGANRTTLDTLYLTLQLITLDYGGDSDLNWRLELARFIAPMVAASTVLQTLTVVFRDEFARLRLRFMKGHTVVLGLGATGTRIAKALAADGHTVVGIDNDGAAPGVKALRDGDMPVLVGDATDRTLLESARLGVARQVVVACGADATNVAITQAVRATNVGTRRDALRCAVQLSDAEVCALLRGGDLGGDSAVRVDFFNIHERAARALLASHPPFADGPRAPHLMIMGLGQLGRSLVVAAAQRWAEISPGRALPLTLVDRAATGRWEALRLLHPALAAACSVRLLDLDFEEPSPASVAGFEEALAERPTWVAVMFDDESVAISVALLVRQRMAESSSVVIVRTRADDGIGALVTTGGFSDLHAFPFLDRACTPEVVAGGVRELLARAMHEDYLARKDTAASEFARPWDELSNEQQESSRNAADDVIEGFASIGYELVPLRRWGAPEVAFSAPEVEALSEREHLRWSNERRADGWTYGATRDNQRKLNPLLVDWLELDHDAKDHQRSSTRALPAMLARAGFEPLRRS
jgi:voltage-gated potassium channel Kch